MIPKISPCAVWFVLTTFVATIGFANAHPPVLLRRSLDKNDVECMPEAIPIELSDSYVLTGSIEEDLPVISEGSTPTLCEPEGRGLFAPDQTKVVAYSFETDGTTCFTAGISSEALDQVTMGIVEGEKCDSCITIAGTMIEGHDPDEVSVMYLAPQAGRKYILLVGAQDAGDFAITFFAVPCVADAEEDADGGDAVAMPKDTLDDYTARFYCSPSFPCGNCRAHCNSDRDCMGYLRCYRRYCREYVPGCGSGGPCGANYCANPYSGGGGGGGSGGFGGGGGGYIPPSCLWSSDGCTFGIACGFSADGC